MVLHLSENAKSQTKPVCVLSFSHKMNNLLTSVEYMRIIRAVGVGFVMMGVVGYVVKLVHIPLRSLIV